MTIKHIQFKQVDVFTSQPCLGNPVAVVLDAAALSSAQMQRLATWTNLSETTFILPATHSDADYRLRIFTPTSELAFAGHPTIGSAHAVIEAGLLASDTQELIQECGLGLIPLRVESDQQGRRIWVKAPQVIESTLPEQDINQINEVLGLTKLATIPSCFEVGAKWIVVNLDSADLVHQLQPNMTSVSDLSRRLDVTGVTVFGFTQDDSAPVYLRSFAPAHGVSEDPVCGSGNMCVAAYLYRNDLLKKSGYHYVAQQGHELGRNGVVYVSVSEIDGSVWIGGEANTVINGELFA